jgi:hypothetical protein
MNEFRFGLARRWQRLADRLAFGWRRDGNQRQWIIRHGRDNGLSVAKRHPTGKTKADHSQPGP